jgi:hypothetical protein
MFNLSKIILLFILVFLFACTTKQNNSQSNEGQIPNEVNIDYVFDEYVKSWQVLAQNSNLIAQNYYPYLLNLSTDKHLYNKSFAQALNLGVYSVDLAYANNYYYSSNDTLWSLLYGQKDLSINIGVHQYFGAVVEKKPRCNLGGKGGLSLADYEAILIPIKNHLLEEKREYQAVLILTGACIETIYLATNIHNKLVLNPKSDNDIKLFESYILSQKEQLENITPLLQLYENKAKIKVIVNHLKNLQTIYKQANSEKKYQQIRNSITDLRTSIVLNSL